MSAATRRCWKCKAVKVATEFYRLTRDPLGIQKICKACTRERNARYRAEHRDYFLRKGREHYRRTKDKNPERYQRYKADYLARIRAARATPRGALVSLRMSARDRATAKHVRFDLPIESLLSAWNKQAGTCALTGIPFDLAPNPPGRRMYRPFAPSLDRIKPGGPYTIGNVRLVCVAINVALNRFGTDVFARVARGFLATQTAPVKRDS